MQLFIHSVPTTKLICNQFTVDALEQAACTAEASEAAHIPHHISAQGAQLKEMQQGVAK